MLTVKNFIIIRGFYQPTKMKKNLRQPFCREHQMRFLIHTVVIIIKIKNPPGLMLIISEFLSFADIQ